MNLFSESELAQIVRTEASLDNSDLQDQYTEIVLPTVLSHYDEIFTDFTVDPQLLANSIRYRLQMLPPQQNTDYQPTFLREHTQFITFLKSILRHHYHNATIMINFSPVMIIQFGTETRFIYASQNYFCLPTAMRIHNEDTLNSFFTVLESYNLREYLDESARILSTKYDAIGLLALSLNFNITRQPNIIYGMSQPSLGFNTCCKEKLSTSDCFFISISNQFCIKQNEIHKRIKLSSKTNKRVALKIKQKFLSWTRLKKNIPLQRVLTSNGITSYGVYLAEIFLQQNIRIYGKTVMQAKRFKQHKVVLSKRTRQNIFIARHSNENYPSTIHLFQQDTQLSNTVKHLSAITNLSTFSCKYTCQKCLSAFPYMFKLKRHSASCHGQKNRFVPNKPIECIESVEQQISKHIPSINLQKDGHFVFLSLKKHSSNFIIDFSIKSETTYTHSFQNSCILTAVSETIQLLTEKTLQLKKFRLRNNLGLLAKTQSMIDECNPENELQLNFIKKKVMQYLCHIQVFIAMEQKDQLLGPLLLKTAMQVFLKTNTAKNCSFNTKQGQLSELLLTGPSSGLHFILINKIVPLYSKPSENATQQMNTFINLVKLIQLDLCLDILPGFILSTTAIAKHYYEKHVNMGRKFMFISPEIDLHNSIQKTCKYGFLQAYPTIIHETSKWQSFFQLDFSKFYKNILRNLTPYFGKSYQLIKTGVHFHPTKAKMNLHAFANVFFHCLSSITPGHLHYQLMGPETKVEDLPMDAILRLDVPHTDISGKKVLFAIQFHGDFYHSHMSACHLHSTKQPVGHIKTCDICQSAAISGSKFKPKLWKLGLTEDWSSKHPIKPMTYTEVYERSRTLDKRIQSSAHVDRLIVIYECEVIKFWHRPMLEFLDFFSIPYKSTFDLTKNLGQVFETGIEFHFPLLHCKQKITTEKIINFVQNDKIHGFLEISGSTGPKTAELLKDFKIFSQLSEKKQ